MFVFQGPDEAGDVSQERPVLRTVFHDGCVALPGRDGKWILRYADGSTCEQLGVGQQDKSASLENVAWLSTSAEGQQVGLRRPAPQPPMPTEDGAVIADGEVVRSQ